MFSTGPIDGKLRRLRNQIRFARQYRAIAYSKPEDPIAKIFRSPLRLFVQQLADIEEVLVVQRVEQHDVGCHRQTNVEAVRHCLGGSSR